MVAAAVRAIENQLMLKQSSTRLSEYYNFVHAFTGMMSEGVLSVNNDGIITQLNAAGGHILGVKPDQAIGAHLNSIIEKPGPAEELLSLNSDSSGKKVYFNDTRKKKLLRSASFLHDDSGQRIGAVALLKPLNDKSANRSQPALKSKSFYRFSDIIGESDTLLAAKKMARIASKSPSTVLLHGESGTGKELFAQAIHQGSDRSNQPFISINCAAIPESLIESELFGHEEGAFTGSRKGGQPGKFEVADGGTVFLDEMGDMPMSIQVKLLRVIQERVVCRVGSTVELPIDIRVIAATYKDLAREVAEGHFRKDLFYRLNVLSITVPPLRERIDDIPQLARYLVDKISVKLGRQNVSMSEEFLQKCCSYSWPGNIRELENAIEHALNMVEDGGELSQEDLPFFSLAGLRMKESFPVGEGTSLKDMEKELIISVLEICEGNIIQTAKKLGVSRNTVYRKIREYDIAG